MITSYERYTDKSRAYMQRRSVFPGPHYSTESKIKAPQRPRGSVIRGLYAGPAPLPLRDLNGLWHLAM